MGRLLTLLNLRASGKVIDLTKWNSVHNTSLRTGSTTILLPFSASTGNRTIDWGDGVVEVVNTANPTHTYASNGIYTVTVSGGTTTRLGNTLNAGWQQTVTEVISWGNLGWTSFSSAFESCTQNVKVPSDIPSAVTNLFAMFYNASAFNQPLNSWNTAAVTNMSYMFFEASAFNQPLNSWNTAAVTNMSYMFTSASAFNQPLNSWNTAAVTNMSYMFTSASAFNQPLNSWNTAAVTNMRDMFNRALAFNQSISSWNTAAVTNMANMFYFATAFNQNISGWNTAAVTNMQGMFNGASAFNQPLNSWNTAAVTNMRDMFNHALAFNQSISSWNTAAVTNMYGMFYNASAFNQDIGAWQLRTAGVNMSFMLDFSGLSVENYSRTLIGWANYVSANSNTPATVTLGASGRKYNTTAYTVGQTYNDAASARAYLVGVPPGWTITDAGQA